MSNSLQPHELYSPRNSLGQNTRVVNFSFDQQNFPTQGSNPGLLHCRWILYQLSHKGSPRILEWIAYPFSRGSSWLRNRTGASCIAGGFFTNWATYVTYFIYVLYNLIYILYTYLLQYRRPGFDSWVRKIPWRRKWQSTPVFLPGESHGQRNLAGYSPWVLKSQTQLSYSTTNM